MARDGVVMRWDPAPGDPDPRPSAVVWAPSADAALQHVQRWIRGGAPPPSVPAMEVAGQKPAIQRDEFGNAKGGVRLPEVEAPAARYSGAGAGKFLLLGHTEPLPAETLRRLYPTHADYVAKVSAAAKAALKTGVILPAREKEYRAMAEAAAVPA
jgi:hypothetical protein